MERRGSGFKKIKEDYLNAVNFRKEIEPQFISDRQSFFVTLYNLNYNVAVENVAFGEGNIAIEQGNIAIEQGNVAIAQEKVAVGQENIIFEVIRNMTVHQGTKENMILLYKELDSAECFGRSDISALLNISGTGAGVLLTKMKENNLIEPVKGFGKGKYKFKK